MQLVVRIVDHIHEDPFVDIQHTKRGDVVEAFPDDWTPAKEEAANPHWVIFKVPGLSEREARAMEMQESGERRVNPMLHIRGFALDLSKLPEVGDGSRRIAESVTVTVEQFREARFKKAPKKNPFVIG